MWSLLYEFNDIDSKINETIDLNTKIRKKSNNEYYFWVDADLYIVRIMNISKDRYELSFVYKDDKDQETSSLTNKNQPFRVIDGVVSVLKEVIYTNDPKIIEFNIFGSNKKLDVFRRIMKVVSRKYPEIFNPYKIREERTTLYNGYDMPDGIPQIEGIKFIINRG
jgi:hypothetical protein